MELHRTRALVLFQSSCYSFKKKEEKKKRTRLLKQPSIDKRIPWVFFDGASQGDPPLGVSGAVLYISEDKQILIKYGLGHCTNNKVESTALWEVLKSTLTRNIHNLQIFGDSKMVIEWENKRLQIKAPRLQHLFLEITRQIEGFAYISFIHVYQELNEKVYALSESSLVLVPGTIVEEEHNERLNIR